MGRWRADRKAHLPPAHRLPEYLLAFLPCRRRRRCKGREEGTLWRAWRAEEEEEENALPAQTGILPRHPISLLSSLAMHAHARCLTKRHPHCAREHWKPSLLPLLPCYFAFFRHCLCAPKNKTPLYLAAFSNAARAALRAAARGCRRKDWRKGTQGQGEAASFPNCVSPQTGKPHPRAGRQLSSFLSHLKQPAPSSVACAWHVTSLPLNFHTCLQCVYTILLCLFYICGNDIL